MTVFIDWLSFSLPWTGEPICHRDYTAEFHTGHIVPSKVRPVRIKTSAKASVTVFSSTTRIYFDGNPAKFLTGQNVIGCADPEILIKRMIHVLSSVLPLYECKAFRLSLDMMDIELTRVDVTTHYRVGSTDDEANMWLRQASNTAVIERRGPGLVAPGFLSVGWGFRSASDLSTADQNNRGGSRHSNFKFYNKYTELKRNPPNVTSDVMKKLENYVLGTIRAEAVYRKPALKYLELQNLQSWNEGTPEYLMTKWLDRLSMNNNLELYDDIETKLSPKLRGTYFMWKQHGPNCVEYISKATYHRHRKALKELVNIDIRSPVQKGVELPSARKVVLIDILTAAPVMQPPGIWETFLEPSELRIA